MLKRRKFIRMLCKGFITEIIFLLEKDLRDHFMVKYVHAIYLKREMILAYQRRKFIT